MSHNWGYKQAGKMAKEMGFGTQPASRVAVKTHTRAPRVAKAPPAPVPAAQSNPMPAYAKGGPVKHTDAKQDAAQIKSMVDKSCLKKAKGGAVKKPVKTGKK